METFYNDNVITQNITMYHRLAGLYETCITKRANMTHTICVQQCNMYKDGGLYIVGHGTLTIAMQCVV